MLSFRNNESDYINSYKYIDLQNDFALHDTFNIDWLYSNMILSDSLDSISIAASVIITNKIEIFSYIYNMKSEKYYMHSDSGKYTGDSESVNIIAENGFDSIVRLNNENIMYKHQCPLYSCSLNMHLTRHPVLVADSGKLIMWDSLMYYYSIPRMYVTGHIISPDYTGSVQGDAWIDRQWGDFCLGYEGYTWFSLYLENDVDVMIYKLNNTRHSRMYLFPKDIFAMGDLADSQTITSISQVIPLSFIKQGDKMIPFGWRVFSDDMNTQLIITPDYNYYSKWDSMGLNTCQGICSIEGIYNGEWVSGKGFMEFNGASYENTQYMKLFSDSIFKSDIKLLRDALKKRLESSP